MAEKKIKKKYDVGIDVKVPENVCSDQKCPFHGSLPVRGQMIEGMVVSSKMKNTVVVKKERMRYIPKYERYEKRTGRYPAHNPPCINADVGDRVKIMECRKLSKTVAFTVIEKKE
jgi:small subunit ribosomal protein S17